MAKCDEAKVPSKINISWNITRGTHENVTKYTRDILLVHYVEEHATKCSI